MSKWLDLRIISFDNDTEASAGGANGKEREKEAKI